MDKLYQTGGMQGSYAPAAPNQYYYDLGQTKRAEILRGRYDDAYSANQALARARGALQTLEKDEYTVNDMNNGIDNNLESLVSSGRWEYGMQAVQDSITDMMTNKKVINAVTSREKYLAAEEEKQKRIQAGEQIVDFDMVPVRDPNTGQFVRDIDGNIVKQSRASNWVTERDGIYTSAYEKKGDTAARVHNLMSGIAEDEDFLRVVKARTGLSEEVAKRYLQYGTGISQDKIEEIAKLVLPLYRDSQEGRQHFKELTQLEEFQNANRPHNDTEALSVLESELRRYGMKQEGWKHQYIQNLYQKELDSADPPPAPQTNTTRLVQFNRNQSRPTDIMTNSMVAPNYAIMNTIFDGAGYFRQGQRTVGTPFGGSKQVPGIDENKERFSKTLEEYGGNLAQLPSSEIAANFSGYATYLVGMLDEKGFRTQGETDKELFEKYDNSLQQLKGQAYTQTLYSNDGRDAAMLELNAGILDEGTTFDVPMMGEYNLTFPQLVQKIESEDGWFRTETGTRNQMIKALNLMKEGKLDEEGDVKASMNGIVPAYGGGALIQLQLSPEAEDTYNVIAHLDQETKNAFQTTEALRRVLDSPNGAAEYVAIKDVSTGEDLYWKAENKMVNDWGDIIFEPTLTLIDPVTQQALTDSTGKVYQRVGKQYFEILMENEITSFLNSDRVRNSKKFKDSKEIRGANIK
jgi:hypothetical protein